MYQFLFWWIATGNCGVKHKIDLWRIDRSSWHCLADGDRRVYWECSDVKLKIENEKLKIKKLQACKPDPVVGYHLSVAIITYHDQSAYPVPLPANRRSNEPLLAELYAAFQHARFTRK